MRREPRWVGPFLKALGQTGNVRLAAERAGVDFSTAYQRRKRHGDFAERWEGALGQFKEYAIGVLRERHGWSGKGAARIPLHHPADGSPLHAVRGEELLARPDGKVARVGQSRWTKRSEETFLLELTATGSVSLAAKAAGFSTQAVYRRRMKDRHFGAAWEAAVETGTARVRSYLVEAATRTFDPDELPIAEEHEIPKVTIGEAINIAKMPARDARASTGPGRSRWEAQLDENGEWRSEEEKQETIQRILEKLEGLKSRNDREMREAGWTEHETPAPPWYHGDGPGTVWIPPGWRLVEE